MEVTNSETEFIPFELRLYAGECYLNEAGELCYALNDELVPAAACLNGDVLPLGCGESRTLSVLGVGADGRQRLFGGTDLLWQVTSSDIGLVGRELTGLQVTADDVALQVAPVDSPELVTSVQIRVTEPVELHIMPYNCEASPDGTWVLEAGRFPVDDVAAYPWLTSRYLGEHDWLQVLAKFEDGHWGVILPAFLSYGSSDVELVDIDDEGFVICRDFTSNPVTIEAVYKADPELYASRLLEVLDIVDVALVPEAAIYPAASGRLCEKDSNAELAGQEEEWLQALALVPQQSIKVSTLFKLLDNSWHFADGKVALVPSDGVAVRDGTLTLLSEGTAEDIFMYLLDTPAVARRIELVADYE